MKKIKEIFLYANWKNIFFALLGSAILAFGTNYIYANSNVPEGGMIGVCLIIEKLTGINAAFSNIVITVFCYALAWRLMGMKYILNTSVATIGFSVFYMIFSSKTFDGLIPSMAEYPLLAALVGAIFVEIGTGITHRYGSASSGEQALTMAIVKRGGFEFGWVQFIRDFLVLSLSIVTYEDPADGIYPVIYSILIMTLLTPVTDYIVNAPKKEKFTKRIENNRKGWSPVITVGLIIAIVMTATASFLNDFYPAKTKDISSYYNKYCPNGFTEIIKEEEDMAIYEPTGEIKAGLVFYPGAKVDFTAYAPLFAECARQGILCVVVEMPFNLAVFGINKGLDIPSQFPEVDTWYIGGHSLGGSMAASCAATHTEIFEGIVLLASYSTIDISDYRVLSVYGTRDEVMEKSNYDKYSQNLPDIFSDKLMQKEIVGGNHANFGMYGDQKGDGEATISREEQIQTTAAYIVSFILSQ